jgi:3-hydroxyacyl-CoA dehydrogenase
MSKTNPTIRRAAVIGAGTMGAQIAAHLANCGIPSLLLDVVPAEPTPEETAKGLTTADRAVRDRPARSGLERVKGLQPPPFFLPELAAAIRCGNIEDDLPKIAEADWVIEAVFENLAVKRDVHARIEAHLRPDALVSTNTSGLRIRDIAEGRGDDYRARLVGTHFFNPPRYMHLLEVIPTAETKTQVVAALSAFGERVLGKGIVRCKDTPNFIGNRIGVFAMSRALRLAVEEGYSFEEVDLLAGPLLGRPRSGVFRLGDIVGIDVMVDVARNLYELIPDDPWRDRVLLPEFVLELHKRGRLGEKSGQGFYKRVRGEAGPPAAGARSEILTLDPATMEYRPQQRPQFPGIEALQALPLAERIPALAYREDRVGQFVWRVLSELLLYAGHRAPEIADDLESIDNAMKWGFNWELGPFETWDALGVARSADRMRAEGHEIPALVTDLLASGAEAFYADQRPTTNDQQGGATGVDARASTGDGATSDVGRSSLDVGPRTIFDLGSRAMEPLPARPQIILLPELRRAGRVVIENPEASLIDIGEGVACLEFHSKMNVIGPGTLQMMRAAAERVEAEFAGLVVGSHGPNFSAGANLVLILTAATEGEWEEIAATSKMFQDSIMALKYCARPVVAAPLGLTLGGGCEVCLGSDRIQAAAETYMGLVETGVGVIPAGGGTKEMVIRSLELVPPGVTTDPYPFLHRAFETIGLAKRSGSAHEARAFGLMRDRDAISIHPRRHLHDARERVLELVAAGYTPPRREAIHEATIPVLGESGVARFQMELHQLERGGRISEHDAIIGTKLAEILCGGRLPGHPRVSEQYLLDLEREAFVSLCGMRKTQERIQHTLSTGRPLRN